jgi:chromosome partitioning protein
MKRFIAVNQKGGVGKTFTSYNLAHHLADEGLRVLAGDGDEQANMSSTMTAFAPPGVAMSQLFGSAPLVLPEHGQPITMLLADKEGLRAVERSSLDDGQLVANLNARLAELAPRFDYAVFDTAGSNSRIANALLVASDFAVVPCKIDQDSIDVSVEVLKRIHAIQQSLNPRLVNLGILPNEYDKRQPAQVKALDTLLKSFPQFILPFSIADRSAYREARAAGVPVWKLKGEGDGDAADSARMKTAARLAAHELRAVFSRLHARMEVAA